MSTGTQGVLQSNDMARNLVEAVFRGIFHYSNRLTTGQASRLPSFISGVDRNAPRLLQDLRRRSDSFYRLSVDGASVDDSLEAADCFPGKKKEREKKKENSIGKNPFLCLTSGALSVFHKTALRS